MNERLPRLTVGLPVYNCERFLHVALDALLAQSFTDFALLLSDNASTDGTRAICEEYAHRDRRIRYVRQDVNRGASWNFSHLALQCRTSLFCWHAADDCAAPSYLEACVAQLDAHPAAVLAYTEAMPIDAAGQPLPYESRPLPLNAAGVAERFSACLEPFPYSENVYHGVMRTAQLQRTRLLGFFAGCDRAFSAELALYGPFARVAQPLFLRRIRIEQQTEGQVQSYNAGRAVRFGLREWRILAWNLQSVRRAPLTLRDRARLYRKLLRRLFVQRAAYAYELKLALAAVAGRAPR